MTQKNKEILDSDQIVSLTEEQVESIANATFFEIGTLEISAETTEEEIDMAVESMFSTF